MAIEGDGKPARYRAFISYSHADRAAAADLHSKLERFVLPRAARAVGGGLSYGSRPLRPIFRDETELVPGQDLPGRIRDALQRSDYLIVVCSPAAAESEWVNKEVNDFIALGRRDAILSVVIAGQPNAIASGHDAALECMPEALRDATAPIPTRDLEQHSEQLWVDWRGEAARDRVMFLRVVAALLSLRSLDELVRRDEAERRRASMLRWLSAVAVLALLTGSGLYYAMQLRDQAIRRSNTLAALANTAIDNNDFEQAGRYALLGMAGDDLPLVGFAPTAAEGALLRATLATQRLRPPVNLLQADGVLSTDGQLVLPGEFSELLQVFDAATGAAVGSIFDAGPGHAEIAVSPDHTTLAVTNFTLDGYELRRFDVATGLPVGEVLTAPGSVNAVSFSADGTRIAVAATFDLSHGRLDIWDLATGTRLSADQRDNQLNAAVFAPNGDFVATVGTAGIDVWNSRTLNPLAETIEGSSVDISPDSKVLLIGLGTRIALHPLDGGLGSETITDTGILDVRYSPDGQKIAARTAADEMLVWTLEQRAGRPMPGLQVTIKAWGHFAFTPDSMSLRTLSSAAWTSGI